MKLIFDRNIDRFVYFKWLDCPFMITYSKLWKSFLSSICSAISVFRILGIGLF